MTNINTPTNTLHYLFLSIFQQVYVLAQCLRKEFHIIFLFISCHFLPGDVFADGVDAFIINISIIVGIVGAVMVLMVLVAVMIVCCCCKRGRPVFGHQKSSASIRTAATELPTIEPTGNS